MKRFALLGIAAVAAVAVACNNDITGLEAPSDPSKETFAASLGVDLATMTKLPTGVYYKDLVVGTGEVVAANTDSLFVNYGGYIKDGTLFDSRTNAKFNPADLVPGVRDGLVGMKAGGKRKLVIPSDQGYGGRSIKNTKNQVIVPRQSTLIFDIEVTKVYNPK